MEIKEQDESRGENVVAIGEDKEQIYVCEFFPTKE